MRTDALVFVIVGNALQPFRRLLLEVDRLAGKGIFGSRRVLVQRGHTPQEGLSHVECRDFLPPEEFETTLGKADLIITHAAMTSLKIVRLGKRPIIVPRRHREGEHINDHQVELAEALDRMGVATVVYDVSKLEEAIRTGGESGRQPPRTNAAAKIAQAIRDLTV